MALAWLPAKRSLDTQASHELRQALAGDAELVGRAAAMASRLHQRGADEGVFKGSSSCPEAQGRGLRDRRDLRGQRGRRHDTALRAPDDERGEHILELPDIARPVVGRQRRSSAGR